MVEFGWKAGTEQYSPGELLEFAIAAEEAGFDSIAASDHFHPWAEQGQAAFVWSWLGAVAAKTSKIKLGTSVTCPILRYHPAVIAQAVATLACLAPNRVFLGVGTGEALNEYSAIGAWPAYNIRRHQLAEAIDLIRKLWTAKKPATAASITARARRSCIRCRNNRFPFTSRQWWLRAPILRASMATA